jgi:hypothetical protein
MSGSVPGLTRRAEAVAVAEAVSVVWYEQFVHMVCTV